MYGSAVCPALASTSPGGSTVKNHDDDSAGDGGRDGRLVTAVRGLYERFRQLAHEAAKFGVVGTIAFLTATIGTNLLHFRAGMGPLTSNVIATIAGTCVAFVEIGRAHV